ncbi:MAG: 1-acyl-sn-glycerol-3-phosphate acyltransferase [Candidatus Kerfeldbacteria bacterium]|nr:1-acyl-sn-glycerol-3-phosphate acyltransferase [Candidatus Kerfeldbacteria bacterium]
MPYGHLRYWLLPLLRRRARVVGAEHLPAEGGFLVAPNHNAWIDTPLLAGVLYQSVREKLYFISRSIHYGVLGAISIDPSHPSGVIDVSLDYLNRGNPVIVYPEGRSNPRRELRPPKTGLARLAHLSGRPVIPVGIRGTFGITAPVSLVCFLLWFHRVAVHIGPPLVFERLSPNAISRDRLDETSDRIMRAIAALSGKPFSPDV